MSLKLRNGSRVGVVGGGPAGSLFAYFLLSFASQSGVKLDVDIYEPRDFTRPGPAGCNMCAGIVSESLFQVLAAEGIPLPSGLVQRTIDSYVLRTDGGGVKIDAPWNGKTTAAVQRGGGPLGSCEVSRGGLDNHLLVQAQRVGARAIEARIRDAGWEDGRPQVRLPDRSESYDLLVAATGVNSSGWQLLDQLGLPGRRPETTRAYIAEVKWGRDAISQRFGNSLHILLLDIPRLQFAALIPKGEFLTVVLLGREITPDLIRGFFANPVVADCLPRGWTPSDAACHCSPRINVREAERPFLDRVVLVGDSGVTRLYKDGLGAAYRTAMAAASTAVLHGVSANDFRMHYWPTYRSIAIDNRFGWLIFALVQRIKRSKSMREGVLRMAAREQSQGAVGGRVSTALWEMFTGGAPYRRILLQALHPHLLGRYLWESTAVAGSSLHGQVTSQFLRRQSEEEVSRGTALISFPDGTNHCSGETYVGGNS